MHVFFVLWSEIVVSTTAGRSRTASRCWAAVTLSPRRSIYNERRTCQYNLVVNFRFVALDGAKAIVWESQPTCPPKSFQWSNLACPPHCVSPRGPHPVVSRSLIDFLDEHLTSYNMHIHACFMHMHDCVDHCWSLWLQSIAVLRLCQ